MSNRTNAHLEAGIAVYNAGRHHAAHDAWEERWLDSTGDDERFLHGLIQFTAAIHHATHDNSVGAAGLAESAGEYLADLPADYRNVNLGVVRTYLADLRVDPDRVADDPPPTLTHDERALALSDLGFDASAVAARVFAETDGDYDTDHIEDAIDYARADLDAGHGTSPFVTLVLDFARSDHRDIAYQRLSEHTDRRRARDRDVDGLFEKRE